MLKIMKDL